MWKTPADAPCHDCIGTPKVGSAYCKKNCGYWPKLKKLKDEGKLEWI